MKLINEAINKLVPSKAHFKITLEKQWNEEGHYAALQKISEPLTDIGDTPIEKLVRVNFTEYFDEKKQGYIIGEKNIVDACRRFIQQKMVEFLERNMAQKHPMETKMGLFYQHKVFTKDIPALDNAFVSVYNFYMEKKDTQNTMRLLEFLFIKYKDQFPEQPKQGRRRRRN